MLVLRVVGLTQGVTIGEWNEERARRLDFLNVLPHQSHRHGANPCPFKYMTQHAHGVGAKGSNWHQESQVDALVFKPLSDLRTGIVHNPPRIPDGAHEGVVVLRNAANHPTVDQFAEPVDGESNVHIFVEGGVVKANAHVALEYVGGAGVTWDDPKGWVAAFEIGDEVFVSA